MTVINKTLYQFGKEHIVFESELKPQKFSTSLTDESYYVPSSESAKMIGNTDGSSSNCAYDNAQVTDELINLRRPGLDRVEAQTLVTLIKNDTREKCEQVLAAEAQKAQVKADRQTLIDKALASTVAQSATPASES